MGTTSSDLRRRVALWVVAFAVAIAAALAFSQVFAGYSAPERSLDNISLQKHKRKCDDEKRKKRDNCKDDCGIGRGGYGRPRQHPDNPRRCRNRW